MKKFIFSAAVLSLLGLQLAQSASAAIIWGTGKTAPGGPVAPKH